MATFKSLPGLTYHANFLSPSEQDSLLSALSSHSTSWKRLRNRSVQNWGGLPHARGMIAVPLPPFLDALATTLVAREIFPSSARANHVLVNRYTPGEGILPHTDGPAYVPRAAILSLCAPILMDFSTSTDGGRERVGSLWLAPGSLLVMEGESYADLHHGIAERDADTVDELVLNGGSQPVGAVVPRKERVSLTFRRSAKTIRNPLRLSRR